MHSRVRRILATLAFTWWAAACMGQTQDWTGVPDPTQNPQLQSLYNKAMGEAQQQTTPAVQNLVAQMPAGPAREAAQWGANATVLFSAKWTYWQLLNPRADMTDNAQYQRDYAALYSGCFPQCPPNFASGSSGSSNGKTTSHIAPQNTVNSTLYGSGALEEGMVSPSELTQQEGDAQEAALQKQVNPESADISDDPLPFTAPAELDFNHPETLPDTMPGVSVITFPAPNSDGSPGNAPCMTVNTCMAADDGTPTAGTDPDAVANPSDATAIAPGTPAAGDKSMTPGNSGGLPGGATQGAIDTDIPAAAFSSSDPKVLDDVAQIARLDSIIDTSSSFKQDIADNMAKDQSTSLTAAGWGLIAAFKGPADTAAALIGTIPGEGEEFKNAYGAGTSIIQAGATALTFNKSPDIADVLEVAKAVNDSYGMPFASAIVNGVGSANQYQSGDGKGGFLTSIEAQGNAIQALGAKDVGDNIASSAAAVRSVAFSANTIKNVYQDVNGYFTSVPDQYANLAAQNQNTINLANQKRQALLNDLQNRLGNK